MQGFYRRDGRKAFLVFYFLPVTHILKKIAIRCSKNTRSPLLFPSVSGCVCVEGGGGLEVKDTIQLSFLKACNFKTFIALPECTTLILYKTFVNLFYKNRLSLSHILICIHLLCVLKIFLMFHIM